MESETKEELRPGWTRKGGVMTGTVTRDRLMVIPTKFIVNAKQFLVSAYGDSVRLVMNRLAREIGISYGSLWKENGLSPEESFRLIAEMGETAGWGGITVDGDFKAGKKLTWTVNNCAFCAAESRAADGKCDFMSGVAEGMCRAAYGKEFSVELQMSSDIPARKCVLMAKEANDRKRENWRTAVYFPWLIEGQ